MNISVTSLLKGLAPLFLFIVLLGCSDDDDSSKAGTLNTSIELSSTAALQGRLIINDAVMNVSSIDLNALSLSKNTVRVNREFTGADRAFVLTGRSVTPPVPLEAKSDRYSPLRIKITSARDEYQLKFVDDNGVSVLDYSDFRTNAKPALLVTGSFENRGAQVPVIIAIPAILPLEVTATQNADPIVEVGRENLAEIKLNPAVWLEDITPQMLEAAQRVQFLNRDMIFIHEGFNTNLYDKILLKIETPERSMSFNVTITKPQD